MSETSEHSTETKPNKSKWQPLWDIASTSGFRALLFFAGLMMIGVLLLAYKTNEAERGSVLIAGIFGVITFVTASISAYVSSQMVVIMDRQETEMTNTRMIVKDQHQAMLDSLEETRNIIKQNKQMITASQRQARSAEKALKLSEDMFFISQRAYIGILGIYPEPMPIVKGQPFRMWCEIINTGKTDATDLEHIFGIGFGMDRTVGRPSLPKINQTGSNRTLLAGRTTHLRGAIMQLTDEEFDDIHAPNTTFELVVIGEIKYNCFKDFKDRPETLSFEYVYDLESGLFIRPGATINGKKTIEIYADKDGKPIDPN